MARRVWREYAFTSEWDYMQLHSVVRNNLEPGVIWYFESGAQVVTTNASLALTRRLGQFAGVRFPEPVTGLPDEFDPSDPNMEVIGA